MPQKLCDRDRKAHAKHPAQLPPQVSAAGLPRYQTSLCSQRVTCSLPLLGLARHRGQPVGLGPSRGILQISTDDGAICQFSTDDGGRRASWHPRLLPNGGCRRRRGHRRSSSRAGSRARQAGPVGAPRASGLQSRGGSRARRGTSVTHSRSSPSPSPPSLLTCQGGGRSAGPAAASRGIPPGARAPRAAPARPGPPRRARGRPGP